MLGVEATTRLFAVSNDGTFTESSEHAFQAEYWGKFRKDQADGQRHHRSRLPGARSSGGLRF